MTAVVWVLTAVVVLLALLVVGLLRSHATIVRALHDAGIDVDPDRADGAPSVRVADPMVRTIDGVPGPAGVSGSRAHDIVGATPSGATRTVGATSGAPLLLAFLTAGCTTCATFWKTFAAQDPAELGLPADLRLVIVTKGAELESPADIVALAPAGITTIQSTAAWDDYRIPVAPYFALVDGHRGVVIGEGAAASWDRVRDLLQRSLADAGLGETRAVGRRDVLRGGRARSARVDNDLRAAGIEPGDPRLQHGTDGTATPDQDLPT